MSALRTFSIALIALALCGVAHAQSNTGGVEGLVIDSISLQPISGATIQLEGTKYGAVARDSGQWAIRDVPAGAYQLRVHALGYATHRESIRVRTGEMLPVFVGLVVAPADEAATSRQEPVVITASKHLQIMQEVPVSTSIIDGHDAAQRNPIQLDQVLRYVPGLNVNDDQVSVRGSSGYSRGLGSRVLFLMDGVPMLSGDTGEMKMDMFPIVAIDRVEVVKGAGSALYGSSALGGVINVVTRPPSGGLDLYAKVYGGGWPAPSYSEWQWYSGMRTQGGIDVGFTDKFGALGVTAAASIRSSDGYRQNDDFRRQEAFTKLGYEFSPSLSAWLMINAANDNHGNWIFWRDLAHALLTSDSSTLYQRIYSFKFQTAGIVKTVLSDNVISWTRAGFYRTTVDDNIDALGPDSASKLVSHADAFSIEEQLTHQLSPRTFLTYGVQSTGNVVKSNYYGDRSQWDAALYAQVEQHFDAHVLTTIGMRGTIARTENLPMDGRIDPKFGLSYIVDNDLSFRASAGTGFRAPSLAERFVATRTGTLVTQPNPDLQFERSASYEIGATNTVHAGAVPLTFDAALFWSDYWNLIEPEFVCTLPAQIRFVNVTRACIQGLDAGLTAPIAGNALWASLAYTYMWARDMNQDAPLKYRPRHLLTVALKAKWDALFAGVDVRFASRTERIDDTVALCVNPLTGYSVIPDFDKRVQTFVTDARIGAELKPLTGLPLVFTLNVYNLFQYYYVEIPSNLAPIRNFVAQLEFTL